MTKQVNFGKKQVVIRKATGKRRRVRLVLEPRTYSRESIISAIRKQVKSAIAEPAEVLEALESNELVEAIKRSDVTPPTSQCITKFYMPLINPTRIKIPDYIIKKAGESTTLHSMLDWFRMGAPNDEGIPQLEPMTWCTARIAFMYMYDKYLDTAAQKIHAAFRWRYYRMPRKTFSTIVGFTATYQVFLPPIQTEIVKEIDDIRTVPTHGAVIRWACSKLSRIANYTKAREVVVYYTPEDVSILKEMSLVEELMRDIMDYVLQNYLGLGRGTYNDIDTLTGTSGNRFAYPYDSGNDVGSAVFEIVTTPSDIEDGIWEYNEFKIDDMVQMGENRTPEELANYAAEIEGSYLSNKEVEQIVSEFKKRKRIG